MFLWAVSKTKYSHIPGCFSAWTCHLHLTSAWAFAVYCHRKVSELFWIAVSSRGANWDPVVRHIGAFSEWLSHEGYGMAIMLLVLRPSSDTCAALHNVDILFTFHSQWGERCFPKVMHIVCLHAYLKMGWITLSKTVLHSGSSRTFPKLRKACPIWKKRIWCAEQLFIA